MQKGSVIKKLIYFTAVVFLTSAKAVSGQSFMQGAPFIRNYSAKEINVRSSEVFCWAQDNRGMVYTGNATGVVQFNGREWKQIENANGSIVRDMAVDSLGRVYVGASNDFGMLQPGSSGNMEYQSLAKQVIDQGISFGDIWEIVHTPKGIYFCANEYVFKYSKKKVSVIPVDFLVQDIYLVNDKLYLPTRTGTCQLEDTTLLPVSNTVSFWLTPWKGEQLLTINNKMELATINISTFETSPFNSPVQEILKKEKPFEIDRIDENHFLVATLTDKIIILSNDGDIVQIINKQTGLMNGAIYKVYVDRDKNLWACMSRGIAKIDINYPVLKFGEDQNLTGNVLTSCYFNGVRYIGTLNGIYYLPPFDVSKPDECNKFIRIDVAALECWEFHIYDDRLYAVCSEGIYSISGTTAKLIYDIKSLERGRRLGISPRFPNVFFLALKNKLLALKLTSGNKGVKLLEQFEFPDITKSISKIISDKNGNLWMNTNYDGVYFLRFTDNDIKNYTATLLGKHNGIASLNSTKCFKVNNEIVLSTEDGIFQPQFPDDQTTPDSLITFTYSPAFGDTIYNTCAKVSRVNHDTYLITGEETYFAKLNGGREAFDYRGFNRFSYGVESLSFGGDSIVSICTEEGLFNYNLNSDKRDYKKSFNTVITQVVQNEDSTLFGGCFYTTLADSTKITSLAQTSENVPTIDHQFNSITFHVAALFYEEPELTEFQYQLEGYDKKWGNWSTDDKITYTRLPAGKYTFRAKAINVYGTNSNTAEYKFVVATPWFLTWWAYIFYIMVFAGFMYLVIKLYTRKLKRQKEHLELIVKDRTKEIKEQARQLEEMNVRLIEVDKFKQGINNMIVHDLKNPINTIINLSDFEDNSYWRIIKQAGMQMLNMVSNILDVSKYSDTKLPVHSRKLNLYSISQNAINQVLFLCEQKNITIENTIDYNLVINADKELTERVFVNLLTNAIKFSPNNSIILIHSEIVQASAENKEFVRIMITDCGLGIAEDKMQLLFQKFSQVVERNSGSIKSTGLGLAFCKMAIEAHGGEIGVESELGKGSVFWFSLPEVSSSTGSGNKKNIPAVTFAESNKLSEQTKISIQEYITELQNTEFYKISEILSILNKIEKPGNEITNWKERLICAINAGNEELYKQLIC